MPHQSKNSNQLGALIREIVFGMEDGMVSTLGSISGIAVGSQDKFVVLLSGIVIIAVESISMGIGSYLSNRSKLEVEMRMIKEEKRAIEKYLPREKKELEEFYLADGWPPELARKMADTAAQDKKLMLKEMSYRELALVPDREGRPLLNAAAMYFSYIAGGTVPLLAYFFLPVMTALPVSIVTTLIGLFGIGIFVAHYTKLSRWKSGLRIMLVGGLAFVIGLIVGEVFNKFY